MADPFRGCRAVGTGNIPAGTEEPSEINFERAHDLMLLEGPLEGPGAINRLVQGPAYVWAVLHDQRISSGA